MLFPLSTEVNNCVQSLLLVLIFSWTSIKCMGDIEKLFFAVLQALGSQNSVSYINYSGYIIQFFCILAYKIGQIQSFTLQYKIRVQNMLICIKKESHIPCPEIQLHGLDLRNRHTILT